MTVKCDKNSAKTLLEVCCSLSGEQKEPWKRKPHYVQSPYGDEWKSMRRSPLAAGRPLTHPSKRKNFLLRQWGHIASAENDPARAEKTYQRPHCSFVCTQEQTTANYNSTAKRLDHLATVDLSAVRLSTGYLNEICFLNMICILSGTCLNPSK